MNYQCYMNEDLQYKKLKIGVSPDVEKDIQLILDDNDNKVHQIQEWLQYIEDVKNYFSNEKVAWDNDNEFGHKQDGSVISKGEMPRIKYSILTDGINPEFVVIEEMDYRLEQYGLRKPSLLGITVTTYESHDRVFISLRDYITEQKYINKTYKMKSLLQFIQESKGASLGQRTNDRFEKDILLKNKDDRESKALELKGDKAKKLFKELSKKLGIGFVTTPEVTEDGFCNAYFKNELPQPILNALLNGPTDYLMLCPYKDKRRNRVISTDVYELRPLQDLLKRI